MKKEGQGGINLTPVSLILFSSAALGSLDKTCRSGVFEWSWGKAEEGGGDTQHRDHPSGLLHPQSSTLS